MDTTEMISAPGTDPLDAATAIDSGRKIEQVRQWICVPPWAASNPALHKLQDFHVLLETERGRLVWFAVNQRAVPEPALLQVIARRMDHFAEAPGFETFAGELFGRDDLIITILDGLLTSEDSWGLDAWSRRDIVETVINNQFNRLTAGEIRETIIQKNAAWLHEQLGRFIQNLKTEVIETLGSLRPSVYNYLNAGCPTRRRNRLQAVNLFPIFLPQLFEPKFAGIRCVIDDGKPLIDAIAEKYIVSRPVIRASRGTGVLATREFADNLPFLLQLLREVPATWLPRTSTEWGRLAETVRHIENISRHSVLTTNNRLIFRDCAGRGYRPTDIDSDEWWRVGQEIDEFTRGIREALSYKLGQSGMESNPATVAADQIDRMLLSLGIKRVGRIARRWSHAHRRAQADYEAGHSIMGGIFWPLVSEAPMPAGELLAHQLPNAEALVTEGAAMHNCVSSYVSNCMRGLSQIWSLKTPMGTRVTTLETTITKRADGTPEIRIGQHAAQNNTKPSKEARKAALELQQQLSTLHSSLQTYLQWKETAAKRSMSERLAEATVGIIITALDEVLPTQWSIEAMIRTAADAGAA